MSDPGTNPVPPSEQSAASVLRPSTKVVAGAISALVVWLCLHYGLGDLREVEAPLTIVIGAGVAYLVRDPRRR